MSTAINTGGPAFPVDYFYDQDTGKEILPNEGMTLRDYFAAKALLAGWAANKSPAYDDDTRAKYAYALADAMLKAREA
jgi:hypothetical protein